MNIRCKFRVSSIERFVATIWDEPSKSYVPGEMWTIKFDVSYDPAFHLSTPSGRIELSLVREEHARHFKLGGAYYADFSPVEPVKDDANEARA